MLNYLEPLNRALKLAVLPYQIGFFQGHEHLLPSQIAILKRLANSDDGASVVEEFEQRLAALIGSGYGISFAAGRMAFYTLMKVLSIGPGDEVILPAFTCSVMPNAILKTGATPVFADIDSDTFGSAASSIEQLITPRTKMIVAQHSFGIPCAIDDIVAVARKHGVFVVEDTALALDSSLHGKSVGNWGDAAIFSTDHSKPLNTLIGGLLYTIDAQLAAKVRFYSAQFPDLARDHQQRLFSRFNFERRYFLPERYPRGRLLGAFRQPFERHGRSFTFLEADYTPHPAPASQGYPFPARLPAFLAQLGCYELGRWKEVKQARKKLLATLVDVMQQSAAGHLLPKIYKDSSRDIVPLRFVWTCPEAERLTVMMSSAIDIGQTWFRQPVICAPEGPQSMGYSPGSCPNAEETAATIINWPCLVPARWQDELVRVFCKKINALYG